MNPRNQYTYLRKELLCRFYNFLFDGTEDVEINRIPYDMIPRSADSRRCCIYKDREMIKYRLLALMGYDFSGDFDERLSLYEFLRKADRSKAPELPPLTVIEAACSSCKQTRYEVSEQCRGCLARPCQTGCPVNAISMAGGKAQIDRDMCINCGKCRSACPYGAVLYIPVPCEDICPAGAIIHKDGTSIEIDREKCISCGKCTRACPFGAIVERSHILPVVTALKEGRDMTLLIAPALYSQFPGSPGQMTAAMKSLGFSRIYELKDSAEEVARLEGAEVLERKEKGEPFMTTSCCPSWVEAVRKHLPSLENRLSHTPSPMELGARIIKEKYPRTLTVFAGPCLAKKVEAALSGTVDYVLNFEELGTLLVSRQVEINDFPDRGLEDSHRLGTGFARSGGVAEAVLYFLGEDLGVEKIDGLSAKAMKIAATYPRRPPGADLLEVMVCEGGCVNGPCSLSS